jgi:hypothetical protein
LDCQRNDDQQLAEDHHLDYLGRRSDEAQVIVPVMKPFHDLPTHGHGQQKYQEHRVEVGQA